MPEYYAHSREVTPPSAWQPLEVHLKNVAEMAKKFAEEFGAGDWGYLAANGDVRNRRIYENMDSAF
jgi:hypothetical protein